VGGGRRLAEFDGMAGAEAAGASRSRPLKAFPRHGGPLRVPLPAVGGQRYDPRHHQRLGGTMRRTCAVQKCVAAGRRGSGGAQGRVGRCRG
jgi:hypothetical protein